MYTVVTMVGGGDHALQVCVCILSCVCVYVEGVCMYTVVTMGGGRDHVLQVCVQHAYKSRCVRATMAASLLRACVRAWREQASAAVGSAARATSTDAWSLVKGTATGAFSLEVNTTAVFNIQMKRIHE